MRDMGNTVLKEVKANPRNDVLYSCAIDALEKFEVDDIITEIKEIGKREIDKLRGIL